MAECDVALIQPSPRDAMQSALPKFSRSYGTKMVRLFMKISLRVFVVLFCFGLVVWLRSPDSFLRVGAQVERPKSPTPTSTPKPRPNSTPARSPGSGANLSIPRVNWPLFTTVLLDSRGKVISSQVKTADYVTEDLGNGVKLEMVKFEKVIILSFEMGSPATESRRRIDETKYPVMLTNFCVGRYEVTQAQWKAVMGSLPPGMNDLRAGFKGDQLPVVRVSWQEAKDFCAKLNERLKLTEQQDRYGLPTEAQWEYAARGGVESPFAFGETITPLIVNYDGNYPYAMAKKGSAAGQPVAVGSYPANAYGLFDMHGNVWEWCEDWYGPYPGSAVTNPTGPPNGLLRVVRGGGWTDGADLCRSAVRYPYLPSRRSHDLGFRLARNLL